MNKKLQVFVSSTYTDLIEERQAAVEAILDAGHIPAGMELFKAGKSQMETIRKWIDESDVYMLILGGRYGSIEDESGLSYTELEYRYAISKNMPVFAVVLEDSFLFTKAASKGNDAIFEKDEIDKYDHFKEFIKTKIVRFVKNVDQLISIVISHLYNIQQDNSYQLVGWVRANNAINKDEFEKIKRELHDLQEKNNQLMNKSYDLPHTFFEAFNLKEMKCFISQYNKINGVITLESQFNRSTNGHIIYFNNNDKRFNKLNDEFIMLAYIYPNNQNWVKYYYNDFGLFFSIRGSQNIKKVQLEIKEKNTCLISVLKKELDVDENKKDFFIRLRDCDIRNLSNISELCFTIYNNYFNNAGKCEFEVSDVWLKQL